MLQDFLMSARELLQVKQTWREASVASASYFKGNRRVWPSPLLVHCQCL